MANNFRGYFFLPHTVVPVTSLLREQAQLIGPTSTHYKLQLRFNVVYLFVLRFAQLWFWTAFTGRDTGRNNGTHNTKHNEIECNFYQRV